ncbi:MAG: hypothetical protein LCH54_02795 [Bacteroidetes bacterium]|nr:hypothetical protein [Bacteroidota bacterium]
MASEPKYEDYSLSELQDSLKNIDKEKYPSRFQKIQYEIDRRSKTSGIEKEKKITYVTGPNKVIIFYSILSTIIGSFFIYSSLMLLFNLVLITPSYFYYRNKRNNHYLVKWSIGIVFIGLSFIFYFYPINFDKSTIVYGIPFMIAAFQDGVDFPNSLLIVAVILNSISWYLFSKIIIIRNRKI